MVCGHGLAVSVDLVGSEARGAARGVCRGGGGEMRGAELSKPIVADSTCTVNATCTPQITPLPGVGGEGAREGGGGSGAGNRAVDREEGGGERPSPPSHPRVHLFYQHTALRSVRSRPPCEEIDFHSGRLFS